MNYEMAVLAALLQLDKPTNPMITETTGISSRRVNLAINNLKDILDVQISWHGPKKTGFYCIDSWGAFESGKAIRRRALALNLSTYKLKKTINYITSASSRKPIPTKSGWKTTEKSDSVAADQFLDDRSNHGKI